MTKIETTLKDYQIGPVIYMLYQVGWQNFPISLDCVACFAIQQPITGRNQYNFKHFIIHLCGTANKSHRTIQYN